VCEGVDTLNKRIWTFSLRESPLFRNLEDREIRFKEVDRRCWRKRVALMAAGLWHLKIIKEFGFF